MTTARSKSIQLDLFQQPYRSGRKAFGYEPEGWPTSRMFGLPITPEQVKRVSQSARERDIEPYDLPLLRTLVLNAYGVGHDNSKGNASLFIDFLINASDDVLEAAADAAKSYEHVSHHSLAVIQGAA